jgi:hypothetical protein
MRTSHWYYDPDYGPYTGHPHDPRTDHDGVDLDLEAAKDEIARTPLFVTDWLAHEATTDETPLDLQAVPAELQQATADQLIALVFAGHIDRIVPAVYELRVRYLRAKDGDITSRAWEKYEDEIKRADFDDNHFWF